MGAVVFVEAVAGPAFGERLRRLWDQEAVVALVPPGLPPAERERLLPAFQADEPVAEGVVLLVATSGSAAAPKVVELTRSALDASTTASLQRLGCGPGDRWLCCLPLYHVAGLQVLLRAAALGSEAIIHSRFDPRLVAADRDATHVSLVPTMLQRLLDARVDLTRFAAALLGGAAVSPALLRRAAGAGARIVRTYGMTETCGGCVYDGLPLDGVDVGLGEDRCVRLRGAVLFHGYRGERPHEGWFNTADIGRFDAQGRLEVLGRRDDVVITGGEKVIPAEVAALLAEHPAVAEVEVFGHPDPDWGERVVAAVVPSDPAAPPTLAQLRGHVAACAASHKAPREIILVPALPRLSTGKPDRKALRTLVEDDDDAGS